MPTDEEMASAHARFWKEQERFDAKLPGLLNDPLLAGRWVVFLDDEVKHITTTREDAHDWAVAHLNRFAGFVIAEVAAPRVYRVGGALRRTT